jgi:hypothetical protein
VTENSEPFAKNQVSWEPFMNSLSRRFRREKRLKRLRCLAVLVLASAAFIGLGMVAGRRPPRGNATLLMAVVPSSTAPVFDSNAGLIEALPGGVFLIHSGGRS